MFVIVYAHLTFQRISKINVKTREIANLLFSLYGREIWSLFCIARLSLMLIFLRFVAKTLREFGDLHQVCFEIKLCLTRESNKEEVVKNGEHYIKRKYMIYT